MEKEKKNIISREKRVRVLIIRFRYLGGSVEIERIDSIGIQFQEGGQILEREFSYYRKR